MRKLYLMGLLWVAISGLYLFTKNSPPQILYHHAAPATFAGSAGSWFQSIRTHCNPVEVAVQVRWNPPPESMEGSGYAAACFALAGRIDEARDLILQLDTDDRWRAAGIVFNVGHPVADGGDDRAAGPIMELVVEFWPNHYMALYHAGASRWALGEVESARHYLAEFLEHYDVEDGWAASARRIIDEIDAR